MDRTLIDQQEFRNHRVQHVKGGGHETPVSR